MKKIFYVFLMLMLFVVNVKAECNDEELNEWATSAEVEFNEITSVGLNSSKYAYVLSVTPQRNDIKIVAYDEDQDKATSKELQVSKEKSVIGIGCYTNLDEMTYTLEIYGAENSACSNQLLKTVTYTVPAFNMFIKDRRCENNDSELCKTFTNATKDMTDEEFDKAITKQSNEQDINSGDTIKTILKYALFVVVPLAVVSIFYVIKIGKYQKAERDK